MLIRAFSPGERHRFAANEAGGPSGQPMAGCAGESQQRALRRYQRIISAPPSARHVQPTTPPTACRVPGRRCCQETHVLGAVEREFGTLKHEWAMLPLRVRRLPRVALHVDLAILAQLADALTRPQAAQAA